MWTPRAVSVMEEVGVDISNQTSGEIGSIMDISFNYVTTVCSHAGEHCLIFSGKARFFHAEFDDPPSLAKLAKNEEEALSHYRRIRDKIRAFVKTLPP